MTLQIREVRSRQIPSLQFRGALRLFGQRMEGSVNEEEKSIMRYLTGLPTAVHGQYGSAPTVLSRTAQYPSWWATVESNFASTRRHARHLSSCGRSCARDEYGKPDEKFPSG